MIFAFIISRLDGELARLQQLRVIVAGLARTAPLATVLAELAPALDPKTEQATRPQVRSRREPAGVPVRRSLKLRTSEPRPLAGAIPVGPVVVSAAALKMQDVQRKVLPETASERSAVDPEALLRELSYRWGTGASTHLA